ncbi:MAG: type II secretion system protein [Magnetospirillum sp.]|nr:type II secretion system protein [Magnetospirillum sp.]
MTAHADSGFTLLELLVVLAIVALLATLGPQWWQAARTGMAAEDAADSVAAAMGEAQRLAIGRGRPVRVYVDELQRSVEVEGGRYAKLPNGVVLAGPMRGPDGKGVIWFHPDGSSTGGQVVVSAPGNAWAVSVEMLTGRVRRVHASAQ